MEKLNFVDVHTHLEMPEFDNDREEVIIRSRQAGITFICTIGTEPSYWEKALHIAENHEEIYFAAGLHPHEALLYNHEIENKLINIIKNEKCLMLGEIGLDFFKNYSPREKQIHVFKKQLDIARELGKPVMIHIRDAHKEAIEILKSKKNNGIIHCFSGTVKEAFKYIDMGYYISIPGIVTYKKAENIIDVVKKIPLDFILSETDAPFLAPEPFRGKRNEPSFVLNTVKKIAEIKNISIEDAVRTIYTNTLKAFNLSISPEVKYVYKIRNSIYINLTNKCSNRCVFCGKYKNFFVKGHYLKLEKDPDFEQIIRAMPQNIPDFDEVVFCGYGEPTLRLDLIMRLSSHLKKLGAKKIRLNTDGLVNLREGKNVLPELSKFIDAISISLNASDETTYNKICKPSLKNAFNSLIEFIKESKKHITEVTVTAVAIPGLDIEKIKNFAENELKVNFRERPYNELG